MVLTEYAPHVLAAIFAGLIVAWATRKRKSLTRRTLRYPLLTVWTPLREKLDITFEGRRIERAELVVIEFENDGNADIEPEDYVRPLTADMGERAHILSAQLVGDAQVILDERPVWENGTLTIPSLLLHKGESFAVACIVDGESSRAPRLAYRIRGVRKIVDEREWLNWTLVGLSGGFGISWLLVAAELFEVPLPSTYRVVGAVLALILAIAGGADFATRTRRRKRYERVSWG